MGWVITEELWLRNQGRSRLSGYIVVVVAGWGGAGSAGDFEFGVQIRGLRDFLVLRNI